MSNGIRIIFLLCCMLAAALITTAKAKTPLYVGVLENINMDSDKTPLSATPHVRVAFQKKGAIWVPMNTKLPNAGALQGINQSYPKTVRWTIVFNGKNLGTIESKNPGPLNWYGDVGVQVITSDIRKIPKIKIGAENFGYTDYKTPYRPLLLVSAPHYRDPDHWKPTIVSSAEKAEAINEFRKHVPKMEHCDQPEEDPVSMIDYKDDDVKLLKAYRSNKDELLLGLQLDYAKDTCGWFDDKIYYDYWFILEGDKTIRFLGIGLTPMEAADIDGNGSSDWIFKSFRGEDEDGYELFYDDFSKRAYFSWTWH